MNIRAKALIGWVEKNLPPLSWQIIVMENMKVFMQHKMAPSKFDDATILNSEVFESIKLSINNRYKIDLPSNIK